MTSTRANGTAFGNELDLLRDENTRLQDDLKRYSKIIEHSNDAIFLVDLGGNEILDANPTCSSMLGYTRDELLSMDITAIHPNEMLQLQQFAETVVAQGRGWTNELTCRTKQGNDLPAEISASVVEVDGRTCLIAILRDTTERRQAEDRIRREAARADALARTAARLNAELDLDTVLHAVCEETAHALDVPATCVLFYDERERLFYPVATWGLPPGFVEEYVPNPRSVYDQHPQIYGSQIVVPNLHELPNLPNVALFERHNIHAIAIASLNRGERIVGALSAYAMDPDRVLNEEDVNLLRGLADQAAQAIRNANLFQAEKRRSAEFKAISEVGRHITSILDSDELLTQIARSIRRIFPRVRIGIALVEGEYVVYRAGVGYLWDEQPKPEAIRALRFKVGEEGLSGWVAATGEAKLVQDVRQEPCYLAVTEPGVRILSELIVPMKVQNQVVGVINVESEKPNAFEEVDLVVLQSFANQAAVALENARLYGQVRQLAVYDERQRLARELHDSVTQALYGMTLYTQAAADLLAMGDAETAADHLTEMQETAQMALREMRLLIFQLRSPALEDGLASALQDRLEAVESRAGLQTSCQIEGIIEMSPQKEDELYRIAQEALNNALKHADARQVSVLLRQGDGRVRLEIHDDGTGFATDNLAGNAGMGLRGMRERSQDIGAILTLDSQPGAGTTICVEVEAT